MREGEPRGGRPRVTHHLRRSFNSLEVPNYRRYFVGQVISLSGTWMQTVAALWLVLTLTGSGFAVGLTTALQFLPMLADRRLGRPARRPLPEAPAADRDPAADGDPRPLPLRRHRDRRRRRPGWSSSPSSRWAPANAVDNPTRQSFVFEMVGPDRVVNAVSLNSVIVQAARIVGPALAGITDRRLRRRPLLRGQRADLRGDDRRPLGDGPARACTARRQPPRGPGRDPRRRCATSPAPRSWRCRWR